MARKKAGAPPADRAQLDAEQLGARKDLSTWEQTALGLITPAQVPRAERVRWGQLALEQTNFNNAIMQAIWKGEESQLAARYEDEGGGGKLKRVGWPEGYRPKLDPRHALRQFMKTRRVTAQALKAVARQSVTMPTGDLAGKVITVVAKENPKKQGSSSATRFALYRNGMTVAEFVTAGGTLGDVEWDTKRGFITLA